MSERMAASKGEAIVPGGFFEWRVPERVSVARGAVMPGGPVTITLPGAKYSTLRYLLAALLAEGPSVVRNPARSDDTRVLVAAMRALGAEVREERDGDVWALRVSGTGGRLRVPPGGVIHAGNAGAVLRMLLGLGALLPRVRFETDHPESLGRRPNAELLDALRTLGVEARSSDAEGLLPITLRGGNVRGGEVTISCGRSSQYLSALLFLAPLLPDGLRIRVVGGLRSAPLVRATLRVLAEAGITVEVAPDLRAFHVPGRQGYQARVYEVPGDVPSAAALAAASVALGVPARLVSFDASGEDGQALLRALDALGVVDAGSAQPGALPLPASVVPRGAVLDGDLVIDSVPVLAALACFAEGETRFENVATLRLKESDRIGDLCAELNAAGCDTHAGKDSITVRGQPAGTRGGVVVRGHDDHRLVQALATAGLRSARGVTITGADAVAKSYPDFFVDIGWLGARVENRETE